MGGSRRVALTLAACALGSAGCGAAATTQRATTQHATAARARGQRIAPTPPAARATRAASTAGSAGAAGSGRRSAPARVTGAAGRRAEPDAASSSSSNRKAIRRAREAEKSALSTRSRGRQPAAAGIRPVLVAATARPQFGLPVGLALGAVEAYLVGPYQAGALAGARATGKVGKQAARAASYAAGELQRAIAARERLAMPARLDALLHDLRASLSLLRDRLASGTAGRADFLELGRQSSAIQAAAAATGAPITILPPPRP